MGLLQGRVGPLFERAERLCGGPLPHRQLGLGAVRRREVVVPTAPQNENENGFEEHMRWCETSSLLTIE